MSAVHSSPPGDADDYVALALIGFAISNFFQNVGPKSTTFLMRAVVFPTRVRATGAGFGAAAGKVGAVVTLLFPLMQDRIGMSTTVAFMGRRVGRGSIRDERVPHGSCHRERARVMSRCLTSSPPSRGLRESA